MAKAPSTSTQLRTLMRQLEAMKKTLCTTRNQFRDIVEEAEMLEDCCNGALQDLESAIDRLSELV